MSSMITIRSTANLSVRKEIQTTYNKASTSHFAVFSPKEKSICLFISLKNSEQGAEQEDFIATISDVNKRCIRLSSQNFSGSEKNTAALSCLLDSDIYEGPFHLEIIQTNENKFFGTFKFDVWYMKEKSKDIRPGFFARIGKFFPGPSKN